MANAYSIPASMGSYTDVVNENLINQVLQSKDKKYDYNVAKIDSFIQKYASIPLAREKDKKYLESRINNIMNAVDGSGQLDMSSSNVTRQIEQNISTAIDDEVVKQMSNSRSISSYEQTVAKIREKDPNLYDDRNYTYAKKMAGVDKYLSGETEAVGSLKYQDYYDVDKNLTVELEKWAKDFGKTKRVEVSPGEFIMQKATVEELTPEQIENFYNMKIQSDPKLMSQMNINADSQYAGVSDEQFKMGYVNTIKEGKVQIEAKQAALKEERKNIPAGSARLLELDAMQEKLEDTAGMYDKEIENPNFNRQSKQLQIYSNNMLSGYKKAYASKSITAIDFDDTPLKIKEFQLKLDKANREKLAETTGQGVGTEFSTFDEITEEKPDVFTQQEKIFTTSFNKLDGYLMANDEDYSKGDAATRKAIRAELVKASDIQDIGAQGHSSDKMKLVDEYAQNSRVYTKTKSGINNKISTEVEAYFNGMQGSSGNINLNNLKQSMPVTAALLGDKSNMKFSSLTTKQKSLVRMEMASNLRDNVAKGDLDKKFLDNYIQTIEKDTGLKNAVIPAQDLGGSAFDMVKASGSLAFQVGAGILGSIKDVFNFNPEETYKNSKDRSSNINSAFTNFVASSTKQQFAVNSAFSNDRNLSNIDSDEISLEQGQSLRSRFLGASDRITKDVAASLGSNLPEATKSVGKSYNPNIKEEKPFTNALQSIVISQGLRPEPSSPYKIQFSPDKRNAIITVNTINLETNDKGVQRKNIVQDNKVTVPIERLPANVMSGINSGDKSWAYSANNPSELKKTHKHKVFQDSDSRDDFLGKFVQNNPDFLSQEDIYNISSNPGKTPFKTTKDYNDIADRTVKVHNLSQEDSNYIKNSIILPDYYVEYERVAGRGFVAKVKKQEGNRIVEVSRMSMGREDYNPAVFSARSFSIIDSVIQKQIEDYARKQSN